MQVVTSNRHPTATQLPPTATNCRPHLQGLELVGGTHRAAAGVVVVHACAPHPLHAFALQARNQQCMSVQFSMQCMQ